MGMYIKFTIISFAFLIANTMAFTLAFTLFRMNESFVSIPGILAMSGVILANCAAIQLLIAGKYSINSLFCIGILPVIGFMISYLLFTRTNQSNEAIMLFSLSLLIGFVLLIMTIKDSQNKKGLVL